MGKKLLEHRMAMITEEIAKILKMPLDDKEATAALSVVVAMLNTNQKEIWEKLVHLNEQIVYLRGFQIRFDAIEKAQKERHYESD